MHEIVHLSSLVDEVGRRAGCKHVIDVGSGLGYLSRTLAFEKNWPVVAVESSDEMVTEAQRIDANVQKKLHRVMKHESGRVAWQPHVGSLRHVAAWLEPDCSPDELWQVVARAKEPRCGLCETSDEATPTSEQDGTIAHAADATAQVATKADGAGVLVGLHTCGDLGPTMLRVFHHAGPAVHALVNVGCCYMKLSEAGCSPGCHEAAEPNKEERRPCQPAGDPADVLEQDTQDARKTTTTPSAQASPFGFPMSDCVASLGLTAGFHIREYACHSLTAYACRLKAAASAGDGRGEASLRLHGRRAILELLLARRGRGRGASTTSGEMASGKAGDRDAGTRRAERAGGAQKVGNEPGGGTRSDAEGNRRLREATNSARVGTIRNAASLTLREYITQSYARCGLEPIAEEDWPSFLAEIEPLDAQWRRVVTFYVLRQLLAPLWEALILLDRLLYLRELRYDAHLVPLFDPSLSPRSYALIAIKPEAYMTDDALQGEGRIPPRCWRCGVTDSCDGCRADSAYRSGMFGGYGRCWAADAV